MREETRNWWKQALKDLESARKNLRIKEYHLVAFLCQQSVEKALKALYIHEKKRDPGKTHSLIHLAGRTSLPKRYHSFVRRLTPSFVNTRYPNAAYGLPYEIYDEKIAREILSKTDKIIAWIKSRMER